MPYLETAPPKLTEDEQKEYDKIVKDRPENAEAIVEYDINITENLAIRLLDELCTSFRETNHFSTVDKPSRLFIAVATLIKLQKNEEIASRARALFDFHGGEDLNRNN